MLKLISAKKTGCAQFGYNPQLKYHELIMNAKPQNQLFLVCPFCQMERFITKHFGDVLFLTAPAAVFYFDDANFLKAVKKTIQSEKITDIYLVGEVSCRFIHYTLQNKSNTGLRCESEIQELLSKTDTAFSLTEKLLKKQLYEISCQSIFGREIEDGQIRIHALLTARHDEFIAPLNCEFLGRLYSDDDLRAKYAKPLKDLKQGG